MATYGMDDGTVVNTERASAVYEESTYFDGRNHVSRATGDQWEHETLHLSAKGRYFVEHWSDWQGSRSSADWASEKEAARWLILNGYALPSELAAIGAQLSE